MKILVTCFSKSGNTKKLADELQDVLHGKNISFDYVAIDSIKHDDIDMHNLFMIGSPCYSNDIAPNVKSLLEQISKASNKKVFLFVTHSSDVSGDMYKKWAIGCERTLYKTIARENICGFFHCKGKPGFLIKYFMKFVVYNKKKTEWLEFKENMMNHPDSNDLVAFRNYVIKTIDDLK